MVMNIFYVSGGLEKYFETIGIDFVFDITPITISISLFVFAYSTFKYDFLDVMPVLKENILSKIEKGIIILDKDYYIIEYNSNAKKFLGIEAEDINLNSLINILF